MLRYLLVILLMFMPGTASAAWKEASSKHILVYGE